MKIDLHQHISDIYLISVNENVFKSYLVMANFMDFKFTGYSSYSTIANLTNLDVHQCIIVICIYFTFHKILFGSYIVMANFMDFKSIQGL